MPNFVFVLTNERYKTYQKFNCRLGVPRGSKNFFFFKHGHVAYQIEEDDEQNRMYVNFLSYGQTGDLG